MTDFYEKNWARYARNTLDVDPAPFLSPLVSLLPPGASILDVGCGAGRDLLWLQQRGFVVSGLERSSFLARFAARHARCPVMVGDFIRADFTGFRVDAILLVGALVHCKPSQVFSVLNRMKKGLVPGGMFLVTLKASGEHQTQEDGRSFVFWTRKELDQMIRSLDVELLYQGEGNSALGTGEVWMTRILRPHAV